MHFFKTAAVSAFAFASLVIAQAPRLSFTKVPTEITAGQPASIQYTAQDLSQPATITLRKGDPSDLDTISILTTNALNGSFTWIPAKSLSDASDYALQITQGSQINYSGHLRLTGSDPAAVSSAMSASASSSAAASFLTASAVSSIQSVIASYNSSLTNLTAIASIQTSPPTSPANTTRLVPSVGTGSPMNRNTTIFSPTLSSSHSSSSSSASTTSSSRTSTRASSTSASASASSTGAAATLAQASTPFLALLVVAAVFFYQ